MDIFIARAIIATILAACLSLFAINSPAAPSSDPWVNGVGFRYRELRVPEMGRTHLTLIPSSETGIKATYSVPEDQGAENTIMRGGAGVAAGDVDGDGLTDLFFCSMGGKSALYRNLGNWRFEEITESAGVACEGQDSTGAVFADVDGDGDLDLLINSIGGGTRLFLNDGNGHFSESIDCGLIRKHGATSMALADIDGNGTLDLYIANFATKKIEDRPNTKIQTAVVNGKIRISALDGIPITSPELTNRYYIDEADHAIRERGEADILYLNDGHGKFSPVPWTGGAFLNDDGKPLGIAPYDWGLSVMFRDLNGDGAPDIYVCNDLFTPDRIWINDGKGHFRILSSLAVRQTSLFSMGVDFADINRDGFDDFVVMDMLAPSLRQQKVQIVGVRNSAIPIGAIENRPQYKRNTLFLNRGDGTFAEIGQLSGLDATGWSWAPVFLDIDLDGYEDLLVTTGYNRDSLNVDAIERMKQLRGNRRLSDREFRELKKLFPRLNQQLLAFRNQHDLTFEDRSHEWGFDQTGISQGICLADLDNDGDLDVVVVRQDAPVALYRNETIAPRVAVRLKGKTPNSRGIGAKIRFLGGPVSQSQEMICGGRYLSGDDNIRVFAAGGATNGLSIEITWRNGSRSTIVNVSPNRMYEIDEAGSTQGLTADPQSTEVKTYFEDVSEKLNHIHHDELFDDFERQPTLSRKLSQLGPGVGWYDIDRDGWEDLLVGSGKGGNLAYYHNDKKGGFNQMPLPPFRDPMTRDCTTMLGATELLLIGSATYEDGATNGSIVQTFDLRSGRQSAALPPKNWSAGPMALADIDGDGELDLFAGGRVIPGRYPEAASSYIFRAHNGQLTLDEANSAQLSQVGLVSGAVFSDLDGDGRPELILACEWGPVRIFHNDHGLFHESTAQLGLGKFSGWWNGVTVGDFDGDGRMDIVASNWGRNTKYERFRNHPLRVYYGEMKETKVFASIEAAYDSREQKWMPWCGLATFAKLDHGIRDRFLTHEAYGRSSVEELLEGHVDKVTYLEANWLESTVFLNRGDHFDSASLPIEAQFAPAFGIAVADFDGDGAEDIFLSQNFSALDAETGRHDAGRGLWLRGDGHGAFTPMPGQVSGVKVYGDQRGCAAADYDHDGRVDLVVTQNGAATKLYHNRGAKRGIRILLDGLDHLEGIGAVIRLVSQGKMGPAREIHAGSGYWSQDGFVQIMSSTSTAEQIWVRWPGGNTIVAPLPKGALEISLNPQGIIRKIR